MAYFSNGTEGRMYEAEYCNNCVHGDTACTVMLLHLIWNYEQNKNEDKKDALDALIPRRKDGFADKCTMFYEKAQTGGTNDK